ncbi:MAG: hypothetical protein LBQ30_08825 [Treponema sp.]|nr:hypothetical protein [Treponema sp.]
MKFRYVFIAFNIIIFFFLLVIGLLSFYILGHDLALEFWQASRFFIALMIFVLVGLDLFYLLNRRLYLLLEREDWPGLTHYLETKIIQDKHYSSSWVRLLANAYFVLAEPAAVVALERAVASGNPSLIETHALLFGTARLLSKDIHGGVGFFSRRLDAAVARSGKGLFRNGNARKTDWIRFYYGFALLLERQFSIAAEQFSILSKEAKDPLTAGLSAFFLTDVLSKVLPDRSLDLQTSADDGRNRAVAALHTIDDWYKAATKLQTEIHGAMLATYLRDAARWIFSNASTFSKS